MCVLLSLSSQQDITPSPLAMLAQTCSRIGGVPKQSVIVPEVAKIDASTSMTQGSLAITSSTNALSAEMTVNTNSVNSNSVNQNNTITINQEGNTMSIIPNVTLLPQMQTINIGGHEALFIPAQTATESTNNPTVLQLAGQALTRSGPSTDVNSTGTVLQLAGQSTKPLQLSAQNTIPIPSLPTGNPIIIQSNGQTVQQVPSFIQMPVSTANGQTIYQTIQIGTVPIPINTGALLQPSSASTQQAEGIIAAALADSQVQLKPSKQTRSAAQKNLKSSGSGEISAVGSQLVQTSAGYMLVPASSTDESGDAGVKPISNAILVDANNFDNKTDFTSLEAVQPLGPTTIPVVSGFSQPQVIKIFLFL